MAPQAFSGSEVGIYKSIQESKKTRTRPKKWSRKKESFFLFRFLGRVLVFLFSYFLVFFYKFPHPCFWTTYFLISFTSYMMSVGTLVKGRHFPIPTSPFKCLYFQKANLLKQELMYYRIESFNFFCFIYDISTALFKGITIYWLVLIKFL